jgi:ectoine hydroxylase-related dioxygenase (phytanoyl-CoA dioxygenase family)
MSIRFSAADAAAYHRDGFFSPVDAFTEQEAAQHRAQLEAFEATLPPGPVSRMDRRKLHVRLPWMRDLVEDPRILDVIEMLIGPDILIYNSTFFVKEKHSDAVTYWHQDGTYFGLEPHEHVTAWVAFSNASEEAGCMQFVPGSHKRGPIPHVTITGGNSLNNVAQGIDEDFSQQRRMTAPLRPGQFSLHHTNVIHASDPNRSGDRRIGVGISYIPTRVTKKGMRASATLVRGVDRFGHFDLEPDPRLLSQAQAKTAHEIAYARYRASYEEQAQRATIG